MLSARDGERLRVYAERLLGRLERLAATGRMRALPAADVAFTLQVGRPALESRLAIVGDSLEALSEALRAFLDGEEHPDVFTSRPDGADDSTIRALADERHLATLVRDGDTRALAPIWTSGIAVDWAALHAGANRRRVPLPTYPFAPERYWFEAMSSGVAPAGTAASPVVAAPAASAGAPPSSVSPAERPVVAAPAVTDDPHARLHEQIRAYVAQGIGLEPEAIDPGRDFSAYGIDSIAALRIMQRIQSTFGDDIAMAAIFEHATLDRFVEHLAAEHPQTLTAASAGSLAGDPGSPAAATEASAATRPVQSAESPPPSSGGAVPALAAPAAARVVSLTASGDGLPLYCVAGDTGELSWALPLLDAIQSDGPVFGVEAPGFPDAPPLADLALLAQSLAAAIDEHDASAAGCRIAGHGLAGALAVEVARVLLERGRDVRGLLLIDAPEPGAAGDASADHLAAVAGTLAGAWGATRPQAHELPASGDAERLTAAVERLAAAAPMSAARLRDWLSAAAGWRSAIAAGVPQHPARPLAGLPAATVVHGSAVGGDWSRRLAPPPRVIETSGTRVECDALAAALAPAPHVADAAADAPAAGVAREPAGGLDGGQAAGNGDLSPLVAINRGGARAPSIWAHHLFGDVSYCMYLSRHLGLDYPLFAVQQIDMESRFRRFGDLRAMCAHYVEALRETFPHGPYTLGGASLGGVVAYEMALQLVSVGEPMAHLCLIDPLMPGTAAWDGVDTSEVGEKHQDALTMMLIGNSFCQLWGVPELIDVEMLIDCDEAQRLDRIASHVAAGSSAAPAPATVRLLAQRKWEVLQLNNELLSGYLPQPFPEPVDTLVFHATQGFSAPGNPYGMPEIRRLDGDRTNGLAGLAGTRLTVHEMEADHFTIVHDENLRQIAELIRPVLHGSGAAEPTTVGEHR